jgi:hypothetical protein
MVMLNFRVNDLRHSYEWNVPENDCKDIAGFPADVKLNCNEGYEVLHFVMRYMDDIGWCTLTSFNNIESMLKTRKPIFIHSHYEIKKWLDENLRKL